MKTKIAGAALVLAVMAAPAFAQAPPNAAQRAAALQLFEDARKLAAAGSYPEACPKFEEAMRLDPGAGTLYNLSDCYEHIGRTASAWVGFREVAEQAAAASRPDREKEARKRIAALEPKLSRLKIVVSQSALVNGLEVKRDGQVVSPALFGTGVPVDPGKHTVSATAPGKEDWSAPKSVDQPGGTEVVEVPVLKDKAGGAVVPPPPTATATPCTAAGAPPPALTQQPDTQQPESTRSWQKPLAFVAMGVGAIGLGVGTAVGFVAKSAKDDSNANGHCVGNACDAIGTPLRNDAVSKGNVATVVFIGGAVFAAGGIVLLITSPSSSDAKKAGARPSLTVGIGPSAATIGGAF